MDDCGDNSDEWHCGKYTAYSVNFKRELSLVIYFNSAAIMLIIAKLFTKK